MFNLYRSRVDEVACTSLVPDLACLWFFFHFFLFIYFFLFLHFCILVILFKTEKKQKQIYRVLDIMDWTWDNFELDLSTVDIGFRCGGSSVVPVLQWYWSYYWKQSISCGNGGYHAVMASGNGERQRRPMRRLSVFDWPMRDLYLVLLSLVLSPLPFAHVPP